NPSLQNTVNILCADQTLVSMPVPCSCTIIFATRSTASEGIVRKTSSVWAFTMEMTTRWVSSSTSNRMPVDQALSLLLACSSAFSKAIVCLPGPAALGCDLPAGNLLDSTSSTL